MEEHILTYQLHSMKKSKKRKIHDKNLLAYSALLIIAGAIILSFLVSPTSTHTNSYTNMEPTAPIVITETDSQETSTVHPLLWLNSGAFFTISHHTGATILGDLSASSPWSAYYAETNPVDTDNGLHPQNIFRLLTKKEYGDSVQTAFARIRKIQKSDSPNRNASNGIFFMHAYQNQNNLYYAGMRVDGALVIKKKQDGLYTTLAYKPYFADTKEYDPARSPNLLPMHTPIGIRSSFSHLDPNTLRITLYISRNKGATWENALSTDTPFLWNSGMLGIRSDFMDVEIENYSIQINSLLLNILE